MVQVSSKLDALAYVFAPLLLEGQVGVSAARWRVRRHGIATRATLPDRAGEAVSLPLSATISPRRLAQ
jgi:hypothetical protein